MYRKIKWNFCLLLFLVVPQFTMADQKAELDFIKGNQLYAKARYKDAVAVYQQLLKNGQVSAQVYYNLGNAFYKLGEMPQAILNYEKAYKLAPGDPDIQVNIRLANLRIADKIEAVPEFFLLKWWYSVILFTSAEVLALLSVIGCLIGFGLLIIYLFAIRISIKRPAFYSGIVVLGVALTLILIAAFQNKYLNAKNSGIVFSGTVNVKSGPDEGLKTLFVIHEGIKVTVLEQNEDWLKVSLPNGNIGWIKSSDIKSI